MKALFFVLLLLNLLLWPVLQALRTEVVEPERLAQQLHPERLSLLAAEPPPAPPPAPVPAAPAVEEAATPACIEVGEFSTATAERFETQLAKLRLHALPSKRLARAPSQYIVFLPPQASAAAAARRLAQLREQGFADSAVIRGEPSRRWAISLGLFSRLDLAEARRESLRAAGVTDARVAEYPVGSARYAYRLSGIEPAGERQLEALVSAFAGVRVQRCD